MTRAGTIHVVCRAHHDLAARQISHRESASPWRRGTPYVQREPNARTKTYFSSLRLKNARAAAEPTRRSLKASRNV